MNQGKWWTKCLTDEPITYNLTDEPNNIIDEPNNLTDKLNVYLKRMIKKHHFLNVTDEHYWCT